MTDGAEDQISIYVGNFGTWQMKIVFICGALCVPLSGHIMIMTFMNADVSFNFVKDFIFQV